MYIQRAEFVYNTTSRARGTVVGKAGTLMWIASEGGPLLLLTREYLRYWEGTDPPTGDRTIEARFRWTRNPAAPATDYDRACDIEDYLGLIDVVPGQALVLGDEPLATTWRSLGPTGGMLVRWSYAPEEAAVVQALARIPDAIWGPAQLVLTVGPEPLYLFDAAYPGAEVEEYLVVELRPGHYTLATGVYEPDDLTSVVLHRFSPAPG